MVEASTPSEKIPVSALEKFSFCKKQGILSLKKRVSTKSDSKQKIIGRILHGVFKTFHEEWTDPLYSGRTKQYGFNRLNLILDAAVDQARVTMDSHHLYLKYKEVLDKGFRRMMEGRNGFVSEIKKEARKLAKNNETFQANALPRAYFKGDPKFEWDVGLENPKLYGRVDCLVEKENEQEFSIWEFKTGKVPDGAPFESHISEATGYAIVYEEESNMKCVGLKILYYGEKKWDIPYNEDLKSKVENKVREISEFLEHEDIPLVLMDNKCTGCEYYEECEKDEKVMGLSEARVPKIEVEDEILEEETDLASESAFEEPSFAPADEPDRSEIEELGPPPIEQEPVLKRPLIESAVEEAIEEEEFPVDAIGIIIQSEEAQYKLSLEKSNLLSGAIKQEYQRSVFPGQVLISHNKKKEEVPSAIVEVKEIKSFPKSLKAPFRKVDMFNIFVETSPFMYYENEKYSRVLFPANFSSDYLRLPSKAEMMKIMNLFGEGINFGLVTYETLEDELPDMWLPYKFPFSFKETGYKGIFVVGSPGKGKTNFLKIMINGISQYIGTPDGQPPAVIVLDITGQFGELSTPTKHATVFDEDLWKLLNIEVVSNLKVCKIIHNHGDGNYTLTLNAIDPELVSLLFPELPPTSSTNFKRMVKKIFDEYPAIDYYGFSQKIDQIINSEKDTINPQVARAIKGAVANGPIEIFDQGGGIPLQIDDVLVPGQVSVIQIDHIVDKMPVLLYLLLMINKKKIYEGDQTPLMLVLDEAHELFPKSSNPGEKEYLRRVSQSLIRIARRGRKKHFGLVFASQQPHDIIPEIIGVFQTKIIMGLESTSGNWIKETLGSEYVNMIYSLGQGYARIWNAELHKGTLVPLFMPKAPNKHEED